MFFHNPVLTHHIWKCAYSNNFIKTWRGKYFSMDILKLLHHRVVWAIQSDLTMALSSPFKKRIALFTENVDVCYNLSYNTLPDKWCMTKLNNNKKESEIVLINLRKSHSVCLTLPAVSMLFRSYPILHGNVFSSEFSFLCWLL